MTEKILYKTEPLFKKRFINKWLIFLCIGLLLISFCTLRLPDAIDYFTDYPKSEYLQTEYASAIHAFIFGGNTDYYFGCLAIGISPLIIFWIVKLFEWMIKAGELVVTDKRVYGKVALGKRVDLPLDSFSSVSLTMALWRGLSVSTASGRITFYLLPSPKEVHQIISQLLIDRQNAVRSITKPESSSSQADELKKYKNLLDSGIITQEEFEAKKKQLLDL